MSEINVINLKEVANVLGNKILSDADFANADLVNAVIEKPVELDEVSFSFGASGNFNVQLFNSEDDIDDDKVIGLTQESILTASPTQAWMKYQVKSIVKASAGIELSNFGFDINGEKSLVFNSYRLHADTADSLRNSVINDFNPFLFIAKLDHVIALKPNEVLSVRMPGKLSVEVSVAWSDIFTGALTLFQSLLKAGEVLNFELSASVEVAFNVNIEDNFSLHIRKNQDNTYQVYINKISSRQIGGSFAAGIEVGFKDNDATRKVLGSVAEGLISNLKGKIQPILDKDPLSQLSDLEKKVVGEIAGTLGINTDNITTAFDLETALGKKLKPLIEEVATSKIKLGFAYEYNRTSVSKVILQAKLDENALKKYHPGLIRFKLEESKHSRGLLTDLREAEKVQASPDGVTLVSYLNERSVLRKQAWGFSLGIGKWVLTGKDHIESKEVIRENFQGNRQVAFAGTRSYTGNLVGNQHNWTVDFNAEMERFSQRPMPQVNELNYSLYLLMEWKQDKNFNKEDIQHIVDQAVLWKILEQRQFDPVTEQLTDLLTGNEISNVGASVHLKFSSSVFQLVFNNIARMLRSNPLFGTELIAKSMAAAMAYNDAFPIRRTVASRTNVYAPLWKACLLKSDNTENDRTIEQDERMGLAFAAQKQLQEFQETLLARQEIDPKFRNSADEIHFSGMLAMNPNIRGDWSAFKNGIITLSDGFSHGLIYDDVVKRSFRNMQAFWGIDHYVRTMGHYLLSFTNNDILMEGVDRSLTIAYTRDGEDKVINMIGKPS